MFKQTPANRKRGIFCSVAIVLLLLVLWTMWGNTALELNAYTISSDDLPGSFDGHRIAHVSDLHNAVFGDANKKLLSLLQNAEPDMIAITGDLIDSRNTDVAAALSFVEKAMQIAPCYYVTGNHEARVSEYDSLRSGLEDIGVVVLGDEQLEITVCGESISTLGVNDPSFNTDYLFGDAAAVMDAKLSELAVEDDAFTILLSHRPELYDVYADCGIDLVLSGHAHGGQFRPPFVGGLIAPNQGFFPKYDAGLYTEGGTNMIVSRGIGNSILPFRFNNRPEVVVVELESLNK